MSAYDISGNSISKAYSIGGSILPQVYDISGNELFSNWIDNLSDSGYTFTDGNETYGTKLMFNFGTTSFQSLTRNTDNGNYYRASTDKYIYPFDSELNALSMITLPSTAGHKNDGCYLNGKIYWTTGMPETPASIYIWNISANTISSVEVPITDNPNGSQRILCANCNATMSGQMFLVTRDEYNSSEIDHQAGDKMCVYLYDVANNTVSLTASYDWDCVYVQGATLIDGKLYVTCNTQTTGQANNYKGITIKVIDISDWSMSNTLTCSGSFEPEGCDSITIGNRHFIWTGVNKYATVSKVILLEV